MENVIPIAVPAAVESSKGFETRGPAPAGSPEASLFEGMLAEAVERQTGDAIIDESGLAVQIDTGSSSAGSRPKDLPGMSQDAGDFEASLTAARSGFDARLSADVALAAADALTAGMPASSGPDTGNTRPLSPETSTDHPASNLSEAPEPATPPNVAVAADLVGMGSVPGAVESETRETFAAVTSPAGTATGAGQRVRVDPTRSGGGSESGAPIGHATEGVAEASDKARAGRPTTITGGSDEIIAEPARSGVASGVQGARLQSLDLEQWGVYKLEVRTDPAVSATGPVQGDSTDPYAEPVTETATEASGPEMEDLATADDAAASDGESASSAPAESAKSGTPEGESGRGGAPFESRRAPRGAGAGAGEGTPPPQAESPSSGTIHIRSEADVFADAERGLPPSRTTEAVPLPQPVKPLSPRTLATEPVRRITMSVGDPENEVQVQLRESQGDVAVRLNAHTHVRGSLEASAQQLVDAFSREQVHLTHLEFSGLPGSGADPRQNGNNGAGHPPRRSTAFRGPAGGTDVSPVFEVPASGSRIHFVG